MLNDAFKLTIDKIFRNDHVELKHYNDVDLQPYPVAGYPDNQNMWQLICCLG